MINAITKRARALSPLYLFLFLLMLCMASAKNISGQTPTLTTNFTYQDEPTITPKNPGICNNTGSVKVKCNEQFNTYTWKFKNQPDLSGQQVILNQIGNW